MMIQTFKNSQNPQQMMQSVIMSNPKMKDISQLVSAMGGDPKAAFYAAAKQKGVDPNVILGIINQV